MSYSLITTKAHGSIDKCSPVLCGLLRFFLREALVVVDLLRGF